MSASGGGASPVGGRGSAQISSDGKTLVMINGNNNAVSYTHLPSALKTGKYYFEQSSK